MPTASRYTSDDILDAWGGRSPAYASPWFPWVSSSDAYDALTVHYDDPEGEGETINGRAPGPHVIAGADIRKATAAILDGRVQVAPRIRDDIRTGELDHDAADVIVQVALFGAIIYG